MVVKAELGTREKRVCSRKRQLCGQRKWDEGGCLQAGDEKKQEQGKQDTQVIPGLRPSFVDKSQLTKLRTRLVV